jgi:hypothetical protein
LKNKEEYAYANDAQPEAFYQWVPKISSIAFAAHADVILGHHDGTGAMGWTQNCSEVQVPLEFGAGEPGAKASIDGAAAVSTSAAPDLD